MHPALKKTDHRPWPLPKGPWSWRQAWKDVLFIHYIIDKEKIRDLIPKSLAIQEYNGNCYLGIVPFRMEGVMIRPLPNLPGISSFLELNVRVYVEYKGRSGVYFLSLDASSLLAVLGGKFLFHLPYKFAQMSFKNENHDFFYHSIRKENHFVLNLKYQPSPDIFFAKPNTLEHFLTERYCLFIQKDDGIYSANVHHYPWPLQAAKADIIENSMFQGTLLKNPILFYSKGVEVVIWDLEKA